jgi:pimeloyl-ACP methyl ester carboxylesterase
MTAERPASPRGQFAAVNDARLYYEERGAGDPLLLLHGGLESSASWAGVVPLLAPRFRVITPDSRGHGRSTNPAGHLEYGQLAADAVALIAALGLERPHVGGWSDGAQVALEIGLRYPDAARSLVVGAAFFDFGEGFRGSIRQLFGMDAAGAIDVGHVEAALGGALPRFRAMHAGTEDEWHAFLGQTAHMWLEYPGLSEADFGRIAAPTLLVVGDRDEFVPVEVAAAMYRMLPTAELAICPNASHSLPGTRPAWLAQTIVEFVGLQDTATA